MCFGWWAEGPSAVIPSFVAEIRARMSAHIAVTPFVESGTPVIDW